MAAIESVGCGDLMPGFLVPPHSLRDCKPLGMAAVASVPSLCFGGLVEAFARSPAYSSGFSRRCLDRVAHFWSLKYKWQRFVQEVSGKYLCAGLTLHAVTLCD